MKRPRLHGAHRGVAIISASSGAGQLITLLAAPVLARLYSPEAFGSFAVLVSLAAIASTVGAMRLDSAIPLASTTDAMNLVKTAAVTSVLVAACCIPITALVDWQGANYSPLWGLAVVPYIVWVTSMYSVLTSYSLRSRNYSAVARRNLLQQGGTAGGQLLVSWWLRSGFGLTLGLAIGRSLGVVSLLRESDLHFRQVKTGRSQADTLRRYWRFPLVFMPSALLNVGATQIPVLFVASRYGTEAAGNLSQAVMFAAVPAALLGGAVSSVVMAEIALRVRSGEVDQRSRYLRVSRALAPLAVAWFLVLVVVAPRALPVILGPEWTSSGAYAAALAVAVVGGLVASPLSVVFVLYERSVMNVGLDVSRVVVIVVLGMAVWSLGYGPVAAVLAMSIGMGVIYAATWFMGLRVVSRPIAGATDDCSRGEAR